MNKLLTLSIISVFWNCKYCSGTVLLTPPGAEFRIHPVDRASSFIPAASYTNFGTGDNTNRFTSDSQAPISTSEKTPNIATIESSGPGKDTQSQKNEKKDYSANDRPIIREQPSNKGKRGKKTRPNSFISANLRKPNNGLLPTPTRPGGQSIPITNISNQNGSDSCPSSPILSADAIILHQNESSNGSTSDPGSKTTYNLEMEKYGNKKPNIWDALQMLKSAVENTAFAVEALFNGRTSLTPISVNGVPIASSSGEAFQIVIPRSYCPFIGSSSPDFIPYENPGPDDYNIFERPLFKALPAEAKDFYNAKLAAALSDFSSFVLNLEKNNKRAAYINVSPIDSVPASSTINSLDVSMLAFNDAGEIIFFGYDEESILERIVFFRDDVHEGLTVFTPIRYGEYQFDTSLGNTLGFRLAVNSSPSGEVKYKDLSEPAKASFKSMLEKQNKPTLR